MTPFSKTWEGLQKLRRYVECAYVQGTGFATLSSHLASYNHCEITNNISYSALYPRQQPWFNSDNPLFVV